MGLRALALIGVRALGFGIQGCGFRVSGLGFRGSQAAYQGVLLEILSVVLGYRVWGLGLSLGLQGGFSPRP